MRSDVTISDPRSLNKFQVWNYYWCPATPKIKDIQRIPSGHINYLSNSSRLDQNWGPPTNAKIFHGSISLFKIILDTIHVAHIPEVMLAFKNIILAVWGTVTKWITSKCPYLSWNWVNCELGWKTSLTHLCVPHVIQHNVMRITGTQWVAYLSLVLHSPCTTS